MTSLQKESSNRSEEHTSELQSLMRNSYAVFCLKKKNNEKNKIRDTINRVRINKQEIKKTSAPTANNNKHLSIAMTKKNQLTQLNTKRAQTKLHIKTHEPRQSITHSLMSP